MANKATTTLQTLRCLSRQTTPKIRSFSHSSNISSLSGRSQLAQPLSTKHHSFTQNTFTQPIRHYSKPLTDTSSKPNEPSKPRPPQPSYDLTFTCKPCSSRSTHRISKQGYHSGSVLITCPSCKNRHVISDHLGIFGDKKLTIEDLMREQGQLIKKGTLSEDGNLEFWSDGSVTERKEDKTEEGAS